MSGVAQAGVIRHPSFQLDPTSLAGPGLAVGDLFWGHWRFDPLVPSCLYPDHFLHGTRLVVDLLQFWVRLDMMFGHV